MVKTHACVVSCTELKTVKRNAMLGRDLQGQSKRRSSALANNVRYIPLLAIPTCIGVPLNTRVFCPQVFCSQKI